MTSDYLNHEKLLGHVCSDCSQRTYSCFNISDRNFNFCMREDVLCTLKNSFNAQGFLVVLLFYVHGKHLRSCRDGQLT